MHTPDHQVEISDFQVQNLSDFSLPSGFRGRPGWYVQIWWLVQSILFNPSPQLLYGWRRFLLRLFGAKIGKNVIIRPSCRVTFPWKVTIGDYSWIGDDVVLYSLGEIVIEDNVVISQKAYLCTGSHDYKAPNFDIFAKRIVVEREAWIATDVFVGPGVKVGTGSVIGARSSVFNDVPALMICTGTPAKPIRKRIQDPAAR